MHVRFTQIKERVTAAPGDSLLAKALSCAVSVVKADRFKVEPLETMYDRNVRFTQIKERVSAAPGDSLLAKALSCAVSVVKADRFKVEPLETMYDRNDKYFCGYQRPFLVNRYVFDCTFGQMILPRLKSSILAGFCKVKSSLESISRKLCILG